MESAPAEPNVDDAGRIIRRDHAAAYILMILLGGYALGVSIVGVFLQLCDPHVITLDAEQRGPVHELSVGHGAAAAVFLVTGTLIRRRRLRYISPRLIAACMPLVLLLSADRVLNVFWPPPIPAAQGSGVHTWHPRRGFTLAPNSRMTDDWSDIFVDRYGMRVAERDWDRRLPDAPRVLFLGDSVTFGFHLPAESCYVEFVNDKFRRRPESPKFQALNAGTISHTPRQALDWLRNEGAALAPDLVVVQICMNDITYALHPAIQAQSGDEVPSFPAPRKHYWSAIMRLAYDWGRTQEYGEDLQVAAEYFETENFDRLFNQPDSEAVKLAWERAFEEWGRMIEFCSDRELPIAMFIVPLDNQIEHLDASDSPQQKIRAFAQERQVPCLDLLPILRSLRHKDGVPLSDLYLDYTHPTRKGHAVFADAILAFLEQHELLERARVHFDAAKGH